MTHAPYPLFFDQSQPALQDVTQRWQLSYQAEAPFELAFVDDQLTLLKRDEPKLSGIGVDFVAGAVAHRRKFGGGRSQAIAKACGLKQGITPRILDATAGLGRDAFVLASLGCHVRLIERHPVVAALLEDGLRRGYLDADIGPWLQQRLQLLPQRHVSELARLQPHDIDVVYLDPMYPHREKSALVKKEMRIFQTLVGSDTDADALLAPATQIANKRVVVKRPDYAEPLAQQSPATHIATKKNRFDVYVLASMTA